MLRFDLCHYRDADIVVEGTFTVSADEKDRDEMNRNFCTIYFLHFKDKWYIIRKAEDLDVVMPMYNLLEYSRNYSKTLVLSGIITDTN